MNQDLEMQGAVAGMGAVTMLVYLAILGLTLVSMWKIYAKAGKPGWAAIVPIYNLIVWLEMTGRPIWWLALLFVPLVNLVISVLMMVDLAKVFGKGTGYAIGLILLPPVFLPMLAFDSSTYQGPAAPAGIAPAI